MKTQEKESLKYRYLLWLYKTLKEELDRTDRKFTQVEVDKEIEKYITRNAHLSEIDDAEKFRVLAQGWKEYIDKKSADGKALKYSGSKVKAEYHFTRLKLDAVERIIRKLFGDKTLKDIQSGYESEMSRRILESREH